MPDSVEDVILKIKSTREPGYAKRVAGAMAWRLRENGFFKVRAVKAEAVNIATKAIAIVNQRVIPAGVLLSMDLAFAASAEQGRDCTAIAMTVQDAGSPRPPEFVEYKVSGKKNAEECQASKLAGAIAAPVREGKGIRMRCIGPGAVYRAILACAIAKGYIYPNNLEAIAVPTWDSIPRTDGQDPISLIQIEFWGKNIA